MAINRTPYNALIDDNGTGTTGSIWNKNAIKTVLLDPIDAAFEPVYGTFTPTDLSGAGLAFGGGTKASWAKLGRLVFVWMQVVYPATANGTAAKIGTLPYIIRVPVGGSQGYGIARTWWPNENSTFVAAQTTAGNLPVTNADLTGSNNIFSMVYLTD